MIVSAFRLAFRNIRRQKVRSATTLCAIAGGCIAIIFVQGYFSDLYFKMRESYIHQHTGHLQICRSGFSKDGRKQPYQHLIDNPSEVLAAVAALKSVDVATPRLQFGASLTFGDRSVSCIVQGIDPEKEKTISHGNETHFKRDALAGHAGPTLLEGHELENQSMSGALIGKGLAAALHAKPGDALTLTAGTVGNSINAWDVTIQGIFVTSSQSFDDHVLRVSIDLARDLLRTSAAQSIVVTLKKTEDTDATKKDLQHLFKEKAWDLEIKTWYELNDFYAKTKELFDKMFLLLKIVIVSIVLLSIYNTMNLSVLERTGEIGTMLALGQKQSDVVRIFMAEGLLLGISGGTLGVLVGSAITYVVGRIGITMPPPPDMTVSWTSEPVVLVGSTAAAFALSIVISLFSTFLPARTASRLPIAEALRTSH